VFFKLLRPSRAFFILRDFHYPHSPLLSKALKALSKEAMCSTTKVGGFLWDLRERRKQARRVNLILWARKAHTWR